MNIIKKSKSLLPLLIAGIIVGSYFLYNAAVSSAAINDCMTVSGNLIQNCSFENPTTLPAGYIKHSTGHVVFPNGYTGLTGWNIVSPIKDSNVGYFIPGFPAPSGTKVLDLSGFVDAYNLNTKGEQAGSGVEQTVYGLTAGQTYTLTFSQGYLAPFASKIDVSINGVSQGVFDLDATTAGSTNISGVLWKDQTITFIATSPVATIRFIHTIPQPGGKVVIYGSALDNVRLTMVPAAPIRVPVVEQLGISLVPTNNQTQNYITDPLVQNINQTTTCSGMATVAKLSDKEVFDLALNKKIGQCTISDLRGTGSYCDYYVNSAVVGKLGATGYPKNPESGDSTGCVVAPTLPKGVNTCWGGYDKETMCTVDYVKNAANQIRKAIADNACGCTASTTTTPIKDVPSPTMNPMITKVNIRSNNRDVTFATTNNVITLNYTLSEIPRTNKVTIDEQSVTPVCSGAAPMYQCSAAIIVTKDIPINDGLVSFTISTVGTVRSSTTATTDGSYVVVKRGTSGGSITQPITEYPPVTGTPDTAPMVLTGSCSKDVVINGTGFTPSLGVAICVEGTFNFPVTVTGDPVFTATPIDNSGHTAFNQGINPPKEDVTSIVNVGPITTSSPAGTATNSTVPNSVWGTPETANGLPNKCIPYFTQYLIKGDRDGYKGIKEVSKIQKFLNQYMGVSIPTDGTFDILTDAAVKSFQGKYVPNIIIPWEISGPTGWWYQSTRSYANYLTGCSEGVVRLDNGVRILDGQIID